MNSLADFIKNSESENLKIELNLSYIHKLYLVLLSYRYIPTFLNIILSI